MVIGVGTFRIHFWLAWNLCHLFIHLTTFAYLIIRVISMSSYFMSQLLLFDKISARYLHRNARFSSYRTQTTWILPCTLPRLSMMWFILSCPYSGIKTYHILPWDGIILRNFRDIDNLVPLPGLRIMQNKSRMLTSHIMNLWYLKLRMVCLWHVQQFHQSITQVICTSTSVFWSKWIRMYCTPIVLIQSATSAGHSLSALSIGFRSLLDCTDCCLD